MIPVRNYIFLLLRIIFKLIPHKIKKSIRLDLNFERILKKNYPENQPFCFIQVGGLDGKSFDGLYNFVKDRNSSGIIIEPLEDYFLKLKENYSFNKNIELINKAVHPKLKEVTLYRVNPSAISGLPDWATGIASLDKDHHKKSGINSKFIVSEDVPADHLMILVRQLIRSHKVDLFQCDVEGFDLETIKMIDFASFKPSIIKFEYVNLNRNQISEAHRLLKSQGYFCFYQFPDIIALQLKKILL